MHIAMIGTGYVGLVSGACFSDFGHVVTCVDKDAAKIAQLRNGLLPIFEPGLDVLIASNVKAGRLSFATESTAPIRGADAVFLAVGTALRVRELAILLAMGAEYVEQRAASAARSA